MGAQDVRRRRLLVAAKTTTMAVIAGAIVVAISLVATDRPPWAIVLAGALTGTVACRRRSPVHQRRAPALAPPGDPG
jgi:chromate transport protein ChrA